MSSAASSSSGASSSAAAANPDQSSSSSSSSSSAPQQRTTGPQTVDPFRPNLIGSLVQCNLTNPSTSLPLVNFTANTPGMEYGAGSTARRYGDFLSSDAASRSSSLVPAPDPASIPASLPSLPSGSRGILIQVHNVTTCVNMGCRLDLTDIAYKCRNTEFNPTRFSACIMRLREPKTTALMFTTGKCVITGARSIHNAHLAARKFGYILSKLNYSVKSVDFKIQNLVAATDVGFPIRLEGLALAHAKFASYEPELFPGLIYRMLEPKVVLLIFVSGKVVITGAKSEPDLARSMERIHPVLEEFRKIVGPVGTRPSAAGVGAGQMVVRAASGQAQQTEQALALVRDAQALVGGGGGNRTGA